MKGAANFQMAPFPLVLGSWVIFIQMFKTQHCEKLQLLEPAEQQTPASAARKRSVWSQSTMANFHML